MKTINLSARYGWHHKLEQIAGDCWKLVIDPKAPQSYRCIGFKDILTEPHSKMGGEQNLTSWYFKTEEEMRLLFPQCPEAYDNTLKIANMCNVKIPQYKTQELQDFLH